MKNFVFLLLCFWGGLLTVNARTMTDFFIDMPDSLMPMLSQNARKDLIDFYRSGMKPILPNEWSANSQLTKVEKSLIELCEDSRGVVTTTFAMLNLKSRDTVICMVRTIKCPQPDSEIFFFSANWEPLKTRHYITLPSEQETRPATDHSVVDYTSISLASKDSIGFTLDIAIDATDDVSDASPDRKRTFRYEWNGSKFTKKT